MAIYRVWGRTRRGAAFRGTFEAADGSFLRVWLEGKGLQVRKTRRIPGAPAFFGRLPWLILTFPFLILFAVMAAVGFYGELTRPGGFWRAAAHGAAAAFFLFVLYNVVLRLGLHYEHAGGAIVEYVRGRERSSVLDRD